MDGNYAPNVLLHKQKEGFAFLRKSHGGCGVPLARRQEPPFESLIRETNTKQKRHPNGWQLRADYAYA